MAKKSDKRTYSVFATTEEFMEKHPNDFENLVALQSREVTSITDSMERIVRIQNASNKCKCIYRRAVGTSIHGLDGNHAMLSNKSMKQLKINECDNIIITPGHWFCYLWNYYDATIRCPFKIAVIFGILSVLLGALSLIISCLCCNC